MDVKYSCPHCAERVLIADALPGTIVNCPHCQRPFPLENRSRLRRQFASPWTWVIGAVLAIGVTSPIAYHLLAPRSRTHRTSQTSAGEKARLDAKDPGGANKALVEWVTDLNSLDPATSRHARGQLQVNAAIARPFLAKVIRGDATSTVSRAQVPQALGLITGVSDPEFPVLLDALTDKEASVRDAAMAALRKNNLSPPRVVRFLTDMSASANAETRRVAALFLGDWGNTSPEALAALEKLTADPDLSVRRAASQSLIKTRPPDLVFANEQLTGALRDLPSADAGVRKTARDRIGAIGRAAVPELIVALENKQATSRDRALAAQALGYAGRNQEPEVPALLSALKDPEATVREYAAASLGLINLDPATLVPLCVDMFSDSSTRVRRRAAENLGRIGPAAAKAIPVLQKIAEADPDTATRTAAKLALQKISPGQAGTEKNR